MVISDNKFKSLRSGLLLGHGGTDRFRKLVEAAHECPYCDSVLTDKSVSVDHILPYRKLKARQKLKTNKDQRKDMDRIENLQLTCGRCNRLKGSLLDSQFRSLQAFLAADEAMKHNIESRILRGYRY